MVVDSMGRRSSPSPCVAALQLVPVARVDEFRVGAGDGVVRCRLSCEERRVSMVNPGHHGAQSQSRGGLRQCAQRRPALQTGAQWVVEDRVEAVPYTHLTLPTNREV